MIYTIKIKLILIVIATLLLVSCFSNEENLDLVLTENNRTVDNFNPTIGKPTIVYDDLIKKDTTGDKQNSQNIIKEKVSTNYESYKHEDSTDTTVIKPQVKEKIVTINSGSNNNNVNISISNDEVIVSVDSVNNNIKEDPEIPKDNSSEIKLPPIDNDLPNKDEIKLLCKDAWFDESKPCDYIPDNLKPTDESGRGVPHFFISKEAWNWGEQQIEDENSEYGCRGFSRMDGYQNDGTQFFFAYLKVCDLN